MKMYYSIGEVAELLDVPATTVRFWESKFEILKPSKDSRGNRRFTPRDIENLKLIYHLVREKGMTIDGARKRLKEGREGLTRDQELMDRLLSVRAVLQEIREELRDVDGVVYADKGPEPEAEKEWIEEELTELETLDDNIHELAGGPIALAEADELLENGEPISLYAAPDPAPQPRIIEQTLF